MVCKRLTTTKITTSRAIRSTMKMTSDKLKPKARQMKAPDRSARDKLLRRFVYLLSCLLISCNKHCLERGFREDLT